jgi:hypothetical protein
VDGRTRAAALLRRVRRELTEFVGPNPTVTQRMMIDRAVILSLRLAQLDRKIVAEEHFTILDNNQYLAWSNSLSRLLDKLGRNTGKRTSAPLNAVLAELAYDTSQ